MASWWAWALLGVFLQTLLLPIPWVVSHEGETKMLPDTCIEGPYHKKIPSAESRDFQECKSWSKHSCCTANISDLIHHHRALKLYHNFAWDLCGPLSDECEKYLKNEECFYQCEPMLKHFQHPDSGSEGYIKNVPVCKNYCEKWFEACKKDKTCVVDWLADFHYEHSEAPNQCPPNSSCGTFAETYQDARGLCDRMWGEAFVYHENDNDCFVMEFDPDLGNPNILREGPQPSTKDKNSGVKPDFAICLVFLIFFHVF